MVPCGACSERGQVRVYQEKIAKWQAQVEERLRVLGQRSGEGVHSFFVSIQFHYDKLITTAMCALHLG
jgi:hypothetical protein